MTDTYYEFDVQLSSVSIPSQLTWFPIWLNPKPYWRPATLPRKVKHMLDHDVIPVDDDETSGFAMHCACWCFLLAQRAQWLAHFCLLFLFSLISPLPVPVSMLLQAIVSRHSYVFWTVHEATKAAKLSKTFLSFCLSSADGAWCTMLVQLHMRINIFKYHVGIRSTKPSVSSKVASASVLTTEMNQGWRVKLPTGPLRRESYIAVGGTRNTTGQAAFALLVTVCLCGSTSTHVLFLKGR